LLKQDLKLEYIKSGTKTERAVPEKRKQKAQRGGETQLRDFRDSQKSPNHSLKEV